jgi:hypothetical protein
MKSEKSDMESDWKIFKSNIPKWREQYLTIKNKEIILMLTEENKTPTEQFWKAKENMTKIARKLTDCYKICDLMLLCNNMAKNMNNINKIKRFRNYIIRISSTGRNTNYNV